QNYQRLNQLKAFCLFDLQAPDDRADAAGVTFYGSGRLEAGVLLYRWQRSGAFGQRVLFSSLKSSVTYRATDVDTGTTITATGSALMETGLLVPFSPGRLSALLFLEAVDN